MQHIVMFSGGASSAFVAKIVATMHGKENTVLLHTPTYSEHPDADRFREQISKHIGIKITEQADGRDIWRLIDDNHTPPSYHIPFCTRLLKLEQTEKYLQSVNGDYILYYGYGSDEWQRVQKAYARAEAAGRKCVFPVFDLKISNEKVKDIIRDDWGICLPEPYKHLKHNNCLPCFKGGKGHFMAVAKYYPEYFEKAVRAEEKTGYTVFKDCTLRDIWDEVQSGIDQIELDMNDIPCMCAF